jgi:hypothetical protein
MGIGVWQGVAMDLLRFHPGPPCPTILCPAAGPPPKQPYGCFRGAPPAGLAGLRSSSTLLDTPRHTPMIMGLETLQPFEDQMPFHVTAKSRNRSHLSSQIRWAILTYRSVPFRLEIWVAVLWSTYRPANEWGGALVKWLERL